MNLKLSQLNEAEFREKFFQIRQLVYEERQKPAFAIERKKRGHNTSRNWDALCGAMDVLLDVSSAFSEFFSLQRVPSHFEALGFLQGLVTVQDSVGEFRCALELPTYKTENLEKIRDFRNRIAGHPVISNNSVPPSSCMIDLSSFTMDGFSCVLYFSEKNSPSKTVRVSYSALSGENFSELLPAWNEVLEEMVESNAKFVKKFVDREWPAKIRQLDYHFGKIAPNNSEEPSSICDTDMKLCREILSEFHRGLSRDGIHAEQSRRLLDLIRNIDDYVRFVKGAEFESRTKRLMYDGLVAQKDGLLDGLRSIMESATG